jgi:hypothetical protein
MSDDGDHPILTLVGLAAVALGVLMVVQPGLAAAIGTDYTAVTVVALLALVQGIRVARARKATELRTAETPDVETVETVPTPGEDFDREVAELRLGPRRMLIRKRADLRETLEAAAVRAVADRENCSREAAAERVETGAWTDDPHAARFLGGPEAPSPPLLSRMRIAASGRSSRQFSIRRTADAIARVAGVTDDTASDGSSGGSADSGGTASSERIPLSERIAPSDSPGTSDRTPDTDETHSRGTTKEGREAES